MSVFDKILEKLGLKKGASKSAPTSTETSGRAGRTSTVGSQPGSIPVTGTGMTPRAISEVDVVRQLEQRAKGSGLDWKVSIVDLLKLLDIDSSREARTELAKELNAPANVMNDSARMNTWLHKEVLKRIAQNGGNIPPYLLD